MFPLIFFSIATITFNKKFGMSLYVNETTYKTCWIFSFIYLAYYFAFIIKVFFNKKVDILTKLDYTIHYFTDIINSVIIIQCISSKNLLNLILIEFIK